MNLIFLLVVPSATSIFIYFVLSSLFVPLNIVIPVVIIMPVLVFGLVQYYKDIGGKSNGVTSIKHEFLKTKNSKCSSLWNLLFICSYIIFLAIVVYFSEISVELFTA